MTKFWWKDEPLIVGSFRWRVINNDLKNDIINTLKQLNAAKTMDEYVSIAHRKGYRVSFKLMPK